MGTFYRPVMTKVRSAARGISTGQKGSANRADLCRLNHCPATPAPKNPDQTNGAATGDRPHPALAALARLLARRAAREGGDQC